MYTNRQRTPDSRRSFLEIIASPAGLIKAFFAPAGSSLARNKAGQQNSRYNRQDHLRGTNDMTDYTYTAILISIVGVLVLAPLVTWIGCRQRKPRRRPDRIEIICPNLNCKYEGEPQKEARGSDLLGLFLCLACLPAGILYFIFKGGYRYLCPKCGMQIRADS